ncbi:TonB-dependent receptor domain-containing protein [Pedobacter alluvionis]|uniref:TonB-dependent receptor n=1 Tax=Pedobacter alluvionis TaxID=475253 RepID=A0A497XLG4_9SPHI|nr:TonB-dependent receptor [Pedobacter alluvionis]RLJ69581.1 TonB-dependent receptor [Pedobacter alluvionis]TFB28358.1 TonB-dependent receptor [Pedobacter alluvionis]
MQNVVQLRPYILFIIMRCSFIILAIQLTFSGILLASDVKSQNLDQVKVNLSLNKATIQESLLTLQRKSGIRISFFDELLQKEAKKITLNSSNITAGDALRKILSGTKLNYRLVKDFIIIDAKPIPAKPGRVSGKITDDKGQAVPGASVRVIETGSGAMSAVDGTYVLNLPPGTYTLEFSFISFQTQRVTGVVVTEDKSTPLDIALKTDTKGLKDVVITSGYKKASVAGLYAQQKNTSNLSDGISGDQISATPDKHVGETLKRITGVSTNENRKVVIRGIAERYNVSLLNGSTLPSTDVQERDFEFNLIPTSLVENIVVAKSITADMPYGFAGGLVQITTKSVPESNFLSVSAGTSFNSRTTGKEFLGYGRGKYDYLGFDDGTRDHFPKDLLNLVGKFDPTRSDEQNEIKAAQVGEQNKRIGGTERLGARRFDALPSQNYQLSLGRTYALSSTKERRLGFVASLSYRNTQTNDYVPNMRRGDWSHEPTRGDDPTDVNTGNIYGFNTTLGLLLNGGFKTEKHQINTYNLYTRIFDNRFSRYTGWTFENPKNDQDMKYGGILEDDRPKFTDLLQNKVSGTHQLNSVKIEWGLARTTLKSAERDAISASMGAREIGNTVLYVYQPGTVSDPGAGPLHRDEYLYRENNLEAVVSAAYDFKLGKTSHTFKTGANYLKKHAFYDWQVLPIVKGTNSTVPIELIPIQDWGNYMSMENPENSLFYFKQDYTSNKFEAKSVNTGTFAMLDHKLLPGLRLVWGIRAEYFKLDTLINSASKLADKNSRIFFAEDKDWYFLPSANITYSPLKDLNLRASYAKAAVRPGLMENSRFSRFNPNYGSVVRSNGVSSTIIDNYDAKIELFPGAGELLSVAYFYKYFDKPAEYYRLDNENNGRGYISIANSDWAKVRGWEFEFRKSLGFVYDRLPFLKDVYISGNLTLQKSEVRAREVQYETTPAGVDTMYYKYLKYPRALYGQVPLLYNAGIRYSGKKLGLNLTYNHAGYKTFITGIEPAYVEYERPRSQMDAQISYKFLKGKIETKLNISNLLDAPFRYFINDPTTYEQKPGTENGLGLEWNDKYAYKFGFTEKFEEGYVDPITNRRVGDRETSTRYVGRTFSFSITYNF